MKISNPFLMNDWPFKKFIIVIAVIQTALIASILINSVGITIPFLREFLGFIYLTFVPGIIILRILKIHEIGSIETFLFSIGLSLATLMFTGFFMNYFYPFLGIKDPISFSYLIVSITVLIIFLCGLSFIRDRGFSVPCFINIEHSISNQFMFLFSMPFFAIIAVYLMNSYQINFVLILLIGFIGLVALLVAFDKIPRILYPFAVFVISISILYQTSLISNYIWGWDINTEYNVANFVLSSHWWNYTILGSNVDSMLSVVILAPIYSLISNISLIWVFKIIYPFLLSLVPLGLFVVFQKQTNHKIAFFSCFLFISFFSFYFDLPQLARQEIAELFFVLIIILLIDKQKNFGKSVLLVIFIFSLIVSHYGLSYIFMLMLISAFVILYLNRNIRLKFKKDKNLPSITNYSITNLSFILLYVVFLFAWYMNVSGSSPFDSLVNIINHISGSIFSDFLNPESTQGLALIQSGSNSMLHIFGKYVQIALQLFIGLGILAILFKKIKFSIDNEFLIYVISAFIILIFGITVPFFASSLNTSRLYQIALFFLVPFGVIGFIVIFKYLGIIFRIRFKNDTILKFFSIFLIIFLFINTGLFYQIFNDDPTSISLSNNPNNPVFNDLEVNGANWLSDFRNNVYPSYGDIRIYLLLNGFRTNSQYILLNTPLPSGTYVSLGTYNSLNNKILMPNGNYSELNDNILGDEIFNNGGYTVYKTI